MLNALFGCFQFSGGGNRVCSVCCSSFSGSSLQILNDQRCFFFIYYCPSLLNIFVCKVHLFHWRKSFKNFLELCRWAGLRAGLWPCWAPLGSTLSLSLIWRWLPESLWRRTAWWSSPFQTEAFLLCLPNLFDNLLGDIIVILDLLIIQ